MIPTGTTKHCNQTLLKLHQNWKFNITLSNSALKKWSEYLTYNMESLCDYWCKNNSEIILSIPDHGQTNLLKVAITLMVNTTKNQTFIWLADVRQKHGIALFWCFVLSLARLHYLYTKANSYHSPIPSNYWQWTNSVIYWKSHLERWYTPKFLWVD